MLMQTFPIRSHLSVGPCPEDGEDVKNLKDQGFTAIFDIAFSWDTLSLERHWAKHFKLAYVRMMFEDGEHIDPWLLDAVIRRLGVLVQEGQRVYLHCTAGISRSPFIATCHVAVTENLDFEDAKAIVEKKNPPTNIWQGFRFDYYAWKRLKEAKMLGSV